MLQYARPLVFHPFHIPTTSAPAFAASSMAATPAPARVERNTPRYWWFFGAHSIQGHGDLAKINSLLLYFVQGRERNASAMR
jgi:hypothetical protein